MKQLPIFVNLAGQKVVLVGEGEAADAKRRLIERAGGVCVGLEDTAARLAFVAYEDTSEAVAVADALKAKGLLVNVVDQPDHCDFTTPAIVDRDPVLVAIGTGGASAGLAKALRQRMETLLPANLGTLAEGLQSSRQKLRERFPDNAARREAIDAALEEAGMLDPLAEQDSDAVGAWLAAPEAKPTAGLVVIELISADPDDLTLRQARLLGQADHIFHDSGVPETILTRARADAVRHAGKPAEPLPPGLILHLRLQSVSDHRKGRV
jgi:uroporphyrin-III C-methyltransferase / precorrin-2 dehydrogenase / sirohydrochlorin ferrochelatase